MTKSSTNSSSRDDLAFALKSAMRQFAGGVALVAARTAGRRYAMAATSVVSLSLDPPSILLCVNQTASMYPALNVGADLCVSLLGADEEPEARLCGGAAEGEARFSSNRWREAEAPYLVGAPANLFCRIDKLVAYGSHVIVIARVTRCETRAATSALAYAGGRFVAVPLSA